MVVKPWVATPKLIHEDKSLGCFTEAISKMVKPWVDAPKLIHENDTLGC